MELINISRGYYESGTGPHFFMHFISFGDFATLVPYSIFIPIFQVQRLRFREIKTVALSHEHKAWDRGFSHLIILDWVWYIFIDMVRDKLKLLFRYSFLMGRKAGSPVFHDLWLFSLLDG